MKPVADELVLLTRSMHPHEKWMHSGNHLAKPVIPPLISFPNGCFRIFVPSHLCVGCDLSIPSEAGFSCERKGGLLGEDRFNHPKKKVPDGVETYGG